MAVSKHAHRRPGSDLSSARAARGEENSRCVLLSGRAPASPGSRSWGARESESYHGRSGGCKGVRERLEPGSALTSRGSISRLRGFYDRKGTPDETNVSAQSPAPQEDAWLSAADENVGRAQCAETAPGERSKAADRLR